MGTFFKKSEEAVLKQPECLRNPLSDKYSPNLEEHISKKRAEAAYCEESVQRRNVVEPKKLSKVCSSEKYNEANIPLEENYEQGMEEEQSFLNLASYSCDACSNVSSYLNVENYVLSEESDETFLPLENYDKLEEVINKLLSEDANLIKANWLQNQPLLSKKYCSENNIFQEEHLPKTKNSKAQKYYSDDSRQRSFFVETEKLSIFKDPKRKKKFSVKYDQSNSLAEKVIDLKLKKESKIQESQCQGIDDEEGKHSSMKMGYFSNKIKKHHSDDDHLLKELCNEVFNFISEIEDVAYSFIETQNSIFESVGECDDIHSEPYCVKSVTILMHFLKLIQNDLDLKTNKAFELKLDSEAQIEELNSYDLENIKDGKEMIESANNFARQCNDVYKRMDRDRVKCKNYYKNLKRMLNFLEKNCCFNITPSVQSDYSSY